MMTTTRESYLDFQTTPTEGCLTLDRFKPLIHDWTIPRKWRDGTPLHSIFQPVHLDRSLMGSARKPILYGSFRTHSASASPLAFKTRTPAWSDFL
ncbi:hypothetical protein AVEN_5423-1 [Araneus ventricosus]|uniref:Uncharacterized protein n=1 Tax=Araneus ventricosus TaxID=182803 RepID=A0A4Y2M8X2_ARAVE|nr:hypothetical protein AVEN_5423-1 [Araneus ventricosus]